MAHHMQEAGQIARRLDVSIQEGLHRRRQIIERFGSVETWLERTAEILNQTTQATPSETRESRSDKPEPHYPLTEIFKTAVLLVEMAGGAERAHRFISAVDTLDAREPQQESQKASQIAVLDGDGPRD